MSFAYPSLLRPTGTETLLVENVPVIVPKVELQFRRWAGAPFSNKFGSKALLDFGGRPVFAELCAYELLRLAGWQARWVETFGAPALRPRYFTSWQDAKPSEQQHIPITDPAIINLLQKIAALNSNSYAGCWDVLGWHKNSVVFTELKRSKKDRMQPTQHRWLAAGLAAGLQPENFLLVEWDFADE